MKLIARVLKDPLTHFLLLGAALFVVYGWIGNDPDGSGERSPNEPVRITDQDVAWLSENWSRQWHRPPTREELRGLVTSLVKEELLAREAREMGLEVNDTIIRRRLAQKLEFLIDDTSIAVQPTDAELEALLAASPDRFRSDPRVTFEHLYFSRDRRADALGDAKSALELLEPSASLDSIEVGDPMLMDAVVSDAEQRIVAREFGDDFAAAVVVLEPGVWSGPIESGLGIHLVRLIEVTPGDVPPFDRIRDGVLDAWRAARRVEENDRYLALLVEKYGIEADATVEALIGDLGPRNGS